MYDIPQDNNRVEWIKWRGAWTKGECVFGRFLSNSNWTRKVIFYFYRFHMQTVEAHPSIHF